MNKISAFVISMMFVGSTSATSFGGYAEFTNESNWQYGVDATIGAVTAKIEALDDTDLFLTTRVQTEIELPAGLTFVPRIDLKADYNKPSDSWYKHAFTRGMFYAAPTEGLEFRAGAGYGFGQDNFEITKVLGGVNYQLADLNADYDFTAAKVGAVRSGDFTSFTHEVKLAYTGFDIQPYVLVGYTGKDGFDRYSWVGAEFAF